MTEAATIMLGLGMPRNQLHFVKRSSHYWDITAWDAIPRPFLDPPTHAYVNALAAWIRNESNPAWIDELHTEIVRPTKKCLKFLNKNNDSFFTRDSLDASIVDRTQSEWLQLADDKPASNQIAALQFFAGTMSFPADHQELLLTKLRSNNSTIAIHAVGAAESIENPEPQIVDELRFLTDNPDDMTRSKSMVALAKNGQLDDNCYSNALKMLQSKTKHVVYAGLLGLLKKESINETELKIVNRVFTNYLSACDYEFVNLFATAYLRWVPDAKTYLTELLSDDPQFLVMALEAVESVQQELQHD